MNRYRRTNQRLLKDCEVTIGTQGLFLEILGQALLQFALYGEASGAVRDPNVFRNCKADKNEWEEIQKRNPNQRLRKRNGREAELEYELKAVYSICL